MSRRADELNTTSFAMLGMLAIQPWSTYELAKHVEHSLRPLWPRARSNLFNEPKKLVAHAGVASEEMVGRRPRTVYTITPWWVADVSRRWLGTPGEGPMFEFEQLLKVFFVHHGTSADALHAVANVSAWADGTQCGEHRRRPQLPGGHRPLSGTRCVLSSSVASLPTSPTSSPLGRLGAAGVLPTRGPTIRAGRNLTETF